MILLTMVRVWFKRHTWISPSVISLCLGPVATSFGDVGGVYVRCGVPGVESGTSVVELVTHASEIVAIFQLSISLILADDNEMQSETMFHYYSMRYQTEFFTIKHKVL